MSTTDLLTGTAADELPPGPAREGRRSRAWARVALACALLAAAGGARAWQGRRVGSMMEDGRKPPFALAELPLELGSWRGTDGRLDPHIAAGTGSTDNIRRTYVDQRTGVVVGVIVLYGPAVEVFIHAPELCYPAAGYAQAEGPIRRDIGVVLDPADPSRSKTAPFSSLIFAKGEGGAAEREMVYYTWRHGRHPGDTWSPQQLDPKRSHRIPGIYKVHVARRAAGRERLRSTGDRPGEDPCESFLAALLPEIERRLAASQTPADSARRVASQPRAEEKPR